MKERSVCLPKHVYSINQPATYVFLLGPYTYLRRHIFDFPLAFFSLPALPTHPLLHHLLQSIDKNLHNTSYLRMYKNACWALPATFHFFIVTHSKMPKATPCNKYVENATKISFFPTDTRIPPSLARTFSKGPKTGREGSLAHLPARCHLGAIWDERTSKGIASRPFG